MRTYTRQPLTAMNETAEDRLIVDGASARIAHWIREVDPGSGEVEIREWEESEEILAEQVASDGRIALTLVGRPGVTFWLGADGGYTVEAVVTAEERAAQWAELGRERQREIDERR